MDDVPGTTAARTTHYNRFGQGASDPPAAAKQSRHRPKIGWQCALLGWGDSKELRSLGYSFSASQQLSDTRAKLFAANNKLACQNLVKAWNLVNARAKARCNTGFLRFADSRGFLQLRTYYKLACENLVNAWNLVNTRAKVWCDRLDSRGLRCFADSCGFLQILVDSCRFSQLRTYLSSHRPTFMCLPGEEPCIHRITRNIRKIMLIGTHVPLSRS